MLGQRRCHLSKLTKFPAFVNVDNEPRIRARIANGSDSLDGSVIVQFNLEQRQVRRCRCACAHLLGLGLEADREYCLDRLG